MKVAIVGGGGSGLTSAWLLEQEHEVTVFEQDSRFGGHAHTVDVNVGEQQLSADAGFEFFWPKRFPTFLRLLDTLGVDYHSYKSRLTVELAPGRTIIVPPIDSGRPMLSSCTPGAILDMAALGYTSFAGESITSDPTNRITLREFLRQLPLPVRMREEFVLAVLLAGWCVEPEEFKSFVAYDVLSYFPPVQNPMDGLRPTMMEIKGGTRSYIRAMERDLHRSTLRLSSGVQRIVKSGRQFEIITSDGLHQKFDSVIVATNAAQAAAVLSELNVASQLTDALKNVRYFKTKIAIHGDERWMPKNRNHWSFVNIRSDRRYAHTTVWKPWRGEPHIFKSWITHTNELPSPLYKVVTFDHPCVDQAYFKTQDAVKTMQGENGVWLAGVYTAGIDCHESAVLSAMRITEALSPHSMRLKVLKGLRSSSEATVRSNHQTIQASP